MASSTGKIAAFLRAAAWVMVLGLTVGQTSLDAQARQPEGGPPGIEVYHEPLDAQDLPPPGEMLSLPVQVENTRDINMKMEAVAAIDGKFMQAPLANQFLNKEDMPEFLWSVQAPVSEMSYQFILYQTDGTIVLSPRYYVKRECVISTTQADLGAYTKLQGAERLNASIDTAKKLKLETAAYSQAITLIDQLQKVMKE